MNNDSIRCGGQISCVLKWENTVTEVYNGHKRKEFTNKRKTRIFLVEVFSITNSICFV